MPEQEGGMDLDHGPWRGRFKTQGGDSLNSERLNSEMGSRQGGREKEKARPKVGVVVQYKRGGMSRRGGARL